MAELTTLEEKLAEVIGLAEAAVKTTEKVEGLVEATMPARRGRHDCRTHVRCG